MARYVFGLAALALGAVAQTNSYTDANTGITFAAYNDATSGTQIGLALPKTPSSDFIGQIVGATTNSSGWTGLDLGPGMTNKLLIVAWPNGDDIMASFRYATGYAAPGVYSGNVTMYPIEKGTFVNSTHYQYTFLCKGCIGDADLSFDPSASTATGLGWAHANIPLSDPSEADVELTYHEDNSGTLAVTLADAESADYATWAALAATTPMGATSSSSGSGSNSTVPATSGGNSTASAGNSTLPATTSNSTYDYIVAGGGAAGIVVAERLAESGKSVLLLERGAASTYSSGGRTMISAWNDTTTAYDVPSMSYYLSDQADTAYCTDTASQAGCLLGGGSEVNALMFVRPQDVDFDDKWPAGWKSSDVAPSAEKFYARNPGTITPSMDGKRYDQGAYNTMSSFLGGLGWSSVDAISSPNEKHNVYSYPPWNIQNGLRAGPVMTYLPLAKKLPNFTLQLNSMMVRAIRTGSTVSGVEVQSSTGARQIINLKAGGKVILASGTMSTPRILFNSGIGPSAQIQTAQSNGVSVPAQASWINLPVGVEVKDHPIITIVWNTTDARDAVSMIGSDFTAPSMTNEDLFAQGSGPLVQSGQRLVFWTSVIGTDNITRYIQGTTYSPSPKTIKMKLYLTHGLTSKGSLGLTSTGATEFTTSPYLNTAADKAALAGFVDKLLASSRTANSTLSFFPTGGLTVNATGADIIKIISAGDHFVGTAKMGTDDGRTGGSAVVDTNTKVYGTDNLFVVDASIHPDLPTGNTQAIVYVVAEHAAAKILALASTNTTSTASATFAANTGVASATMPGSVPTGSSGSSSGASSGSGSSAVPYYPSGTAVGAVGTAASTGFTSSPTGTTGKTASSVSGSGSGTFHGHYQPKPHKHSYRPEGNFRPVMKPESAEVADEGKWKASFLDGYYKAN